MNKILWLVIGFLTLIIMVMALILFAVPAEAPTTENGTPVVTPTPSPTTQGALHDRVIVASPKSGTSVDKDFKMTGEAPGNWYFEASFPYKVLAPNGDVLANLYCQAQGEWMTTEQVPFVCNVQISGSYSGPATVVLMKDNPSGLPENDDSIDFQIVVKK